MSKPIALFDIDNTIYDGFSYFALLEKQAKEGIIRQEIYKNALARMQQYKAGDQDYETTIVRLLDLYATGLKGQDYQVVLESAKRFYKRSDAYFAYVEPTIKQLKRTHDISLVTGEPQFVAEAVGAAFGIGSYYSSKYEVASDGTLTGRVLSHLASRHEKQYAIQHLMHAHGRQHSFAFGDSEGDIEMLGAAAHAICLNPTEELRKTAMRKGWHLPANDEVYPLVMSLMPLAAGSQK